jgi:hypothetical protein
MNLKGVQTFGKKSGKFTKILARHGLPQCEFILTHLDEKFGCSLTSGNYDLV